MFRISNILRKALFCIVALTVTFTAALGQKVMTPPHVLIVPDMIYCKAHNYVKTFDNMGVAEEIPDYERALNEDASLHGALTQMAQLITDRNSDIVIKDLNECINLAKTDASMSTAAGGDVSESIEEAIIRNSAADIIIKLNFDLLKAGPKYAVTYTIRGTDAYTGRTFAPLEGVGAESTSANPVMLLREAIYGSMDGYMKKMLQFYKSMTEKGRMIAFDIKVASSSPHRMTSRFGDMTLSEYIDDFLYDNSVDGGGLEQMKGGDTFMQYQGIYIPLTTTIRGRQRRQGAKDVAQKLVSHLDAIGVKADYKVVGLGKVNLFIR